MDDRERRDLHATLGLPSPPSWDCVDDDDTDTDLGEDLDRTRVDGAPDGVPAAAHLQELARSLEKSEGDLRAALAREARVVERARAYGEEIVRIAHARERKLEDELAELAATCDQLIEEKLELVATVEALSRAGAAAQGCSETAPPAPPASSMAPMQSALARPRMSTLERFEAAFGTDCLLDMEQDEPDCRDAHVARKLRYPWFSARTLMAFAAAIAVGVFMFYSASEELGHGISRIQVPVHETYGTASRFDLTSGGTSDTTRVRHADPR